MPTSEGHDREAAIRRRPQTHTEARLGYRQGDRPCSVLHLTVSFHGRLLLSEPGRPANVERAAVTRLACRPSTTAGRQQPVGQKATSPPRRAPPVQGGARRSCAPTRPQAPRAGRSRHLAHVTSSQRGVQTGSGSGRQPQPRRSGQRANGKAAGRRAASARPHDDNAHAASAAS